MLDMMKQKDGRPCLGRAGAYILAESGERGGAMHEAAVLRTD